MPQPVVVPHAPAIPGLAFRRFGGAADFPAMVAVANANCAADQVDMHRTVEDMARDYASLPGCDLEQDLLVAQVDGEMVGYTRGWFWTQADGQMFYGQLGFLAPQWRRRGIGGAMLSWLEQPARDRRRLSGGGRPPSPCLRVADRSRSGRAAGAGRLPAGAPFLQHGAPAPGSHCRLCAARWNRAAAGAAGTLPRDLGRPPGSVLIALGQCAAARGRLRHLAEESRLPAAAVADRLGQRHQPGRDGTNNDGANRVYEACGFEVVKRNTVYRKPVDL